MRVTVKSPVSGPNSEAAGSLAAMDTAGTLVSEMVMVALPFPMLYAALLDIVRMTVSEPSTVLSVTGVTVMDAEFEPTPIVAVVPIVV